MELSIDRATQQRLEQARELGQREVRPVGLEADRLGRPIPVDHPYFQRCLARGEGRTRWSGPDRGQGRTTRERTTVLSLLVAEELAYWDRGVGVANPGPNLPEMNVLGMGTEEQKARFLGRFVEPDRPRWASFAMTEPGAGSDAAAIQTSARKDGATYVINGAKCFIGNASRADWILVQCTLDPRAGRAAQRAFFRRTRHAGAGPVQDRKEDGAQGVRVDFVFAAGRARASRQLARR
jgi:acyl-CoA dehydrogenase